jgi:hypothetical protein
MAIIIGLPSSQVDAGNRTDHATDNSCRQRDFRKGPFFCSISDCEILWAQFLAALVYIGIYLALKRKLYEYFQVVPSRDSTQQYYSVSY